MSLVSRWKLDQTPRDAFGNNNGSEVGTVTYSTSVKKQGSSSFSNAGGGNKYNFI